MLLCRLEEVPGNWYRLNRVLEILISTGRPLGELNLDVEAPLDYDFRCFFLNRNRIDLYRRIDSRSEDMICGGLLQVPLFISAFAWGHCPQLVTDPIRLPGV